MSERTNQEYLYIINYPTFEKELALLELRSLFGRQIEDKFFYSELYIPPSRSVFLKVCITILYKAGSLDDLVQLVAQNEVSYEDFKFVRFSVVGGELGYHEWVESATELGAVIQGEIDMFNPKHLLGVTCLRGQWVFGIFEKNENPWIEHDKKPHTYSNSLAVRTARSLVNVAVGPSTDITLVDPCCGIGTVVIEAASMGIDVKGFEIKWQIADKANKNLVYLGYERLITNSDMHKLTERYATAILDLPYGVFTHTTPEKQQALIRSLRRIADRAVIITFENTDETIEKVGFKIIDKATVSKGQFTRIIRVCE